MVIGLVGALLGPLIKVLVGGKSLDRGLGADVVTDVLRLLLDATQASDDRLARIEGKLDALSVSGFKTAMTEGNRYLIEAERVWRSAPDRQSRMDLARQRLVQAASAARVLDDAQLIAEAEVTLAACDALRGSLDDVRVELDLAAVALERWFLEIDAPPMDNVFSFMATRSQQQALSLIHI